MPTTRSPRKGSLQFWPRKRAKRHYARVRSWITKKEVKPLGFIGYKAGMTHIIAIDNRATTKTKGSEIFIPVTIIECPPIKVLGIRFYKKSYHGLQPLSQILAQKNDKELIRKIKLPKSQKLKIEDIKEFDDLKILVYSQPKLTGIGKKKPEIIEVALGGSKEDKLKFAKENLGKELLVNNVFKEGQQVDIHSITKGKGYQGPVKRFGVKIRSHKSEKTKRGPANLGAWTGSRTWTVAHAGKMGFHQRTEYNKWLLKISDKPEEINPKGGFVNFGFVKNNYLMLKGSIGGSKKRAVIITDTIRPNKKILNKVPEIKYISLESKQGK